VLLATLMATLALTGGPDEIIEYRESGDWARDTRAVIRRARRVVARSQDEPRPAIVLDIDDTSLSNYACLKQVRFVREDASCGELPAIASTRRLYRFASSEGVAVFFITGRRERLRASTAENLRAAGYDRGWRRLYLRPNREAPGTHDGWKARTRAAIERRGFTIVANVGDQLSDLDGGHAQRRFKLPNPMYVIEEA
jgi:predicted secreted acid phosphatase